MIKEVLREVNGKFHKGNEKYLYTRQVMDEKQVADAITHEKERHKQNTQ